MRQESLNFEVKLSGTHWNKYPEFSVWLDDQKILSDKIIFDTHTIKFERDLEEGEHLLKIRLENKDQKTDTVIENGQIVKDMLLNIDDIVIDDISLGNLLWTADYQLDHPQEYQGNTITKLDHCVNLGWNGTYILKFSSPFYIWLLEKL
jgi:hypothetical protein